METKRRNRLLILLLLLLLGGGGVGTSIYFGVYYGAKDHNSSKHSQEKETFWYKGKEYQTKDKAIDALREDWKVINISATFYQVKDHKDRSFDVWDNAFNYFYSFLSAKQKTFFDSDLAKPGIKNADNYTYDVSSLTEAKTKTVYVYGGKIYSTKEKALKKWLEDNPIKVPGTGVKNGKTYNQLSIDIREATAAPASAIQGLNKKGTGDKSGKTYSARQIAARDLGTDTGIPATVEDAKNAIVGENKKPSTGSGTIDGGTDRPLRDTEKNRLVAYLVSLDSVNNKAEDISNDIDELTRNGVTVDAFIGRDISKKTELGNFYKKYDSGVNVGRASFYMSDKKLTKKIFDYAGATPGTGDKSGNTYTQAQIDRKLGGDYVAPGGALLGLNEAATGDGSGHTYSEAEILKRDHPEQGAPAGAIKGLNKKDEPNTLSDAPADAVEEKSTKDTFTFNDGDPVSSISSSMSTSVIYYFDKTHGAKSKDDLKYFTKSEVKQAGDKYITSKVLTVKKYKVGDKEYYSEEAAIEELITSKKS